jgi:hypothetical protein
VKRKESIGRLLLSLMTALFMVIGVFGGAVYTNFSEHRPEIPLVASEPEDEMSVIGEAPISAKETENKENTEEPESKTLTDFLGLPSEYSSVAYDEQVDMDPAFNDRTDRDVEIPLVDEKELAEKKERGTRASFTVDADGPYGTKDSYLYEGSATTFYADTSGFNGDYLFRWDYEDDGTFDTPWEYNPEFGVPGDRHARTHMFLDDNIGQARVQAWDGVTMLPGPDGNMLNEMYYDYSYWLPVPRFYEDPPPNGNDGTWGLEFAVYADCTVDQLGYFRTYAPTVYNQKLWDMDGNLLGVVPYPPYASYDWGWGNIKDPADPFGPDITVDLEAGKNYIVSAYIYYSDGRYPKNDNPGPTPDGVMEPIQNWFNTGGDSFPGVYERTGDVCLLDVHYTSSVPDAAEDTSEIFFWNIPPTILSASASPSVINEGEAVYFDGMFFDPGTEDDWFYMWDYGDYTNSGWLPVPKGTGGATILFVHTFVNSPGDDAISYIKDQLQAEMGGNAVVIDDVDISIDPIPELSTLLQYDVVITGANWLYPGVAMGDLLADYSDAGGNVIECTPLWMNTANPWAIDGRWRDEDYMTMESNFIGPPSTLGPVYDPTHPIMDGVAPWTNTLITDTDTIVTDATLLADFDTGFHAVTYRDYGHHGPDSGRIVGINQFLLEGYLTGDWVTQLANAIMWAADAEDFVPFDLTLPIPLPTHEHKYMDDHPVTTTTHDDFEPVLYVKDDDHCNDVIVGEPLVVYQDFEEDWGQWGDNPPAGWTILDYGDYPTTPPKKYPADKFWGTDMDSNYNNYADNYLMSPALDCTGSMSILVLSYSLWYQIEGYWDHCYVEISGDQSTWTELADYSSTAGTAWTTYTHDISSFIGDASVWVRFRFDSDSSVNYRGAYVDDLKIYGYDSYSEVDLVPEQDFQGTFPPSGWSVVNNNPGEEIWRRNDYWPRTNYAGGDGYCADADSDAAYPDYDMDTELRTPSFSLVGAIDPILTYISAYNAISSSESADVDISTNGGSSWTNLLHWNSDHSPYGPGEAVTLDLSPYVGNANCIVRFHYDSNGNWAWWWEVDDVRIWYTDFTGYALNYEEDFDSDDGGYTHSGAQDEWEWGAPVAPWDNNDWCRYDMTIWGYSASTWGHGTASVRWYPAENQDEWLISPTIDTSVGTYSAATLEFDHWWLGLNYDGEYAEVLLSTDGGVTWPYQIDYWDSSPGVGSGASPVHEFYDLTSFIGGTITIAFHFDDAYNDNIWYLDNVNLLIIPELRHVWGLSEYPNGIITVHNVHPSVEAIGLVSPQIEPATFVIDELRISDPAMWQDSEEFWWRLDESDPWQVNYVADLELVSEDFSGSWPPAGWTTDYFIQNPTANAGGTPPEAYLSWIDAWLAFGSEFLMSTPVDTSGLPALTLEFKDLYDHFSGPINIQVFTRADSGDSWTDVTPWNVPATSSHGPETWTIDISHDIGTGTQVMFEESGNGFNMNFWYIDDVRLVLTGWGEKDLLPLRGMTLEYGDNGKYYYPLYIIDDDMNWDFSGGYPVYTGPPEDIDLYSGYTHVEMEVLNEDPTITPPRAMVNTDLVIRTTGEPNNNCVMTLWEGTTSLGSVTVYHEGNYKMETLPATLDMSKINDYYVTVEYTNADPDGANPTWVFETRFASGHIKELKNVFKEDGDLWVIGPEYLKEMILGEDIIFTADGHDPGSDDLIFFWQYGDGEYGVNIYANALFPGPCGPVSGGVCLPDEMGHAHPDHEPSYDQDSNDIRSPEINPIDIDDKISHAYTEPGMYYVCLILLDDDAEDMYPSYQYFLNDGGYDIEYILIDLAP